MRRLLLGSFLLVLFASGCTMAPRYERPEAPVPGSWPAYSQMSYQEAVESQPDTRTEGEKAWTPASIQAPNPEGAAEAGGGERATDELPARGHVPGWRQFFTDASMQRLIGMALDNNRDLRLAALNIERMRGQYQIQRGALFPSIQAVGSNSNQLLPADVAPIPVEPVIQRQTSATVGFTSFELDLFGRVRSLKDAALENYFSSTFNAYSVQVSLIGEVAGTYLQLVTAKEQFNLAYNTYVTRRDSLELTRVMVENGVTSELVLNQARATMEEARVSMVSYQTQVLQYENALILLLGAPIPEDINVPDSLAAVERLRDLPAGLPSELLERRPDILQAEHTLKSANANIGAARANFFPRIGITANIGTMSTDFSNLFTGPAKTWLFAPQILLPIFEGGSNIAQLDVAHVQKAMAVTSYEKAIQTAFREVADTLAQRSTITEQLDAARALMQAYGESYRLSSLRFDAGVDSYLNVLDSQRYLFSAQQAYISTLLLREINTLTMYKTMGGGWEQLPE